VHASHPAQLHGDHVLGTVFVDVKTNLEYVALNVTPSLNAVFLGCANQLGKIFSENEDETAVKTREMEEKQLELERMEKRDAQHRADQKSTLRRIWGDEEGDKDQHQVRPPSSPPPPLPPQPLTTPP
jgi:hypothetical protein